MIWSLYIEFDSREEGRKLDSGGEWHIEKMKNWEIPAHI